MRGFLTPPVLALLLTIAAAAGERPRVTTDTAEYCGSLVARLSTLPAAGREPSRSLAVEGMRLCDAGHVRTGIAKLRRAVRAAQLGQ
ncbi:hypothetical protein GCM10011504_35520 [Siccirubricoccus deserti]|nr:hypothetical protein GCM10011504_35520 [Siccirubricoccus deserti]